MKLIIGNKYQVLEPGLNQWIEDCTYVGEHIDTQENVFTFNMEHCLNPNLIMLLYVHNDHIETDVKEN